MGPDDTASDSGVDTDVDSDYTSISSMNYQFREESGRRYFPSLCFKSLLACGALGTRAWNLVLEQW